MYEELNNLNDLEILRRYCEKGLEFLDPRMFREIENRNLTKYVNRLGTKDKPKAWAVIVARLAADGRYFTDDEINTIAAEIQRLEVLREKLNKLPITESPQIAKILADMQEVNNYIKDYFEDQNFY